MSSSKMSLEETVQVLREEVRSNSFVDAGARAEQRYEVSRSRLNVAIDLLRKNEGYVVHYIRATQHGSGKPTTVKILTNAGVTYKEAVLLVFRTAATA